MVVQNYFQNKILLYWKSKSKMNQFPIPLFTLYKTILKILKSDNPGPVTNKSGQ